MLDAIADINKQFPVISIKALPVLFELTDKQLGVFLSLVDTWNPETGKAFLVTEYLEDTRGVSSAITAMIKLGIVKRIDKSEGAVNVYINPSILVPANYVDRQVDYDELGRVIKMY